MVEDGSVEHGREGSGAPLVELERVGKQFQDGRGHLTWVLRDFCLDVRMGEFVTIVGPSGSGKTTLLRLAAGILQPSEGAVTFAGQPVRGPGPERVMVFQSSEAALFEWLTARQNVEFGLRAMGVGRKPREARATAALHLVGLGDHAGKFPHELSGGMQQRLQIARALAVEPKLLLMDEPLAALDAQTRRILLRELVRIWQTARTTFLYVTHDIREAVLLGQRIIVVSRAPARVLQVLECPLPYPRDEFGQTFVELFRKVDRAISEEVGTEL